MTLLTFLTTIYVPSRLTLADSTIAQYAIAVGSLCRHHGRPVETAELSDALILPWLTERLRHAAPKTVARERASILTLWRFAHKKRLVAEYPTDIPLVRLQHRQPVYWRLDELERLLAVCRNLPRDLGDTGIPESLYWCSQFLFLYDTGTRLSAAQAVTPQDVDLPHGTVTLRACAAKTGWEQVCSLSPQTIGAIGVIYDPARPLLWPWPWSKRRVWLNLKSLLRQADLPCDRYRMFHCFRRTCATLTAAASNLDVARRALGHTTEAMTRRYVNESALPQVTAADVLPRPKF